MADKRSNEQVAVFISDWKKRAHALEKKSLYVSIISAICALALCMLLLALYQNQNYHRIISQNMKYVEDSARQETTQIETSLRNVQIMAANLSHQYAILVEQDAASTVVDKLNLLRDDALFDSIGFVSPDGIETDLEGEISVFDREYFQKGMRGETGYEFIDESRLTGTTSIAFYAPVEVRGEIIGVMVGYHGQETLDDLFTYTLFNFKPQSHLLLGNGTEVAHSGESNMQGNLLEMLSTRSFTGSVNYAEILAAIADTQRTCISFSFDDNTGTLIGVIVQFSESNWMLLSVLPYEITASMVSENNALGFILVVSLTVIFALLIFVLMHFLRKQKNHLENEISLASERLVDTVNADKLQQSIIESLTHTYSSVYYIDLAENVYQRITELDPSAIQTFPDTGNAQEFFTRYVDGFIGASYREELHQFYLVSSFAQRLSVSSQDVTEYQRADKCWRRAMLVAAGRDENGTVTGVVFAVQRIDQEKHQELEAKTALREAYYAAQVANNAKTSFLSNMSHDIRTPMNAIIGMTTIAKANVDNPQKVSDCLDKINTAGKHLLGLINEVLDMSKIESGNVDLSEDEFSLPDLIDTLISMTQPLIREKNHSLLVKVGHMPHERVIGDSVRLQQVFTNLLSNAIKYTPAHGNIEISITEKPSHKETVGSYEMIFRDNGIGMSEEFQKTLFEPFTRADDQRITRIQGTGLGMSIARNIIRMMNGDITVQSQLNQGTTFIVTFTLRLQNTDEAAHPSFNGLEVLVVDDDETCCESTCDLLGSLGMRAEWAVGGAEAIEKVSARHQAENDYYAVIVDWHMPGMDGLETAQQIRQRVGADVPIIFFSAYDWSEIEQKARAAGVNFFLSKPLFKSRVVALFNQVIGPVPTESVAAPTALPDCDLAGRRVLLVDDNEMNREIAIELLSMADLKIETAENGKIALDMFAQSAPGYYDAVLMDIQMPVMNGYDSAKAMRALSHPDAQKIPIIAMTANAFSSDVRAALNAGMNDHIAKPVDFSRLLRVLHEKING